MSLGTFARLSFSVLALLLLAGRASAQLSVQSLEIEGAQQRIDAIANVPIGPFVGTLPTPAPPPQIAFDAFHVGSWFLDYGISCPSATTLWPNQSGNESGVTSVTAGWDDDFVITALGQSGFGYVDVRLGFDGELSVDGSQSRSVYGVEFFLVSEDGDLFMKDWFGECFDPSGPNVCTGGDVVGDPLGSYPMPGDAPLRARFTFGEKIFIDIRLDARGEAAQSERGEATAAPTLRWLGIAQVLDASMQPVASYSVASNSGFDYRDAFDGDCPVEGAAHDLALGTLRPPKKITLSEGKPSVAGSIALQLQNRGAHDETVPDQPTLESLVSLTVESLGGCPVPAATLLPPKKGFPVVLAPNKKLSLEYRFSFDCVNDPLATKGQGQDHSDFRVEAAVDHGVLGAADGTPANDVCPRAPGGGDKGCGPKGGGEILIDVIVK